MTDREFAQTILAVRALPFVDNVNVPANLNIAIVELSPRLVEVLPHARRFFSVNRDAFSVDEVIRLYKLFVVDYLNEIADLAEQLLREAGRRK